MTTTRWKRVAPGNYESDEGHVSLTFIPAHWDVAVDRDLEAGFDVADSWTAWTLADAKRDGEAAIADANERRGEATR